MTRRLAAIAGIVLAGTLLAGCGALGGAASAPEREVPGVAVPDVAVPDVGMPGVDPGFDAGAEEAASGGDGMGGEGMPGVAPSEDEAVIVSGALSMRVADPIATADRVADEAEQRDGGVDQRSEGASTDFEPAWSTLVVRVPAEEVEPMLTALRALGDVTRVDLGEQRVTAQVRDLEVRVDATRASVERLTELLASAADTETLLEVEAQLTQRTGELEQLLSEQRSLADQVAMSTLQVDIRSTTVQGPTGTPTFWDGLVAGWAAFLAWGAAALYGFGEALPALVLLVLLGLAIWLVVRRILRRRPTSPTAGPAIGNPAGRASAADDGTALAEDRTDEGVATDERDPVARD
ncbi:DUF4349 domain-containing protein [Agrococcus terreus]|uniref:DUF4349 domain-containing protein n=1 Tax=Agrococcus terreus TaxID=574649 RepID=A0ABQ2KDJ7_9MICO|nr:DUF4349 domain-containing protein [Agrococcus terreus]GGN79956.1 hypothetical protein GCM10010968_07390 [Agrococcus terreus]